MKYLANKEYTLQSLHNFSQTTELPRYPLEVFLEISNVCDLKCAMCGTFSALDQWRFFHLKETERGFFDATKQTSLESVLKHAVLVHCFGYGEPTIHPNFKEIIAYISEFEVLIDFFTNGMHLTEELCEFLVQKKVFRVYVSFSGSTKEDYENVYIGGNFETVLNGIKLLSKTKKKYQANYPQIEINSLAFQHHVDKIVDFVSLMAKYGANTINLKPLEIHNNIPYLNHHVAIMRPWVEGKLLKKANIMAFFKRVKFNAHHFIETKSAPTQSSFEQQRSSFENNITISINKFKSIAKDLVIFKPEKNNDDSISNTDDLIEKSLCFDYPLTLQQPCFEPFKTLYVMRNGQTKPCCFGQNVANLGNINQLTADNIWQNNAFLMIKENILSGKYPMGICKECINRQSGPQYHGIIEITGAYHIWLQHSYHQNISKTMLKKISTLKDNHSVIYKPNAPPIMAKKIVDMNIYPLSQPLVGFYIEQPQLNLNIENNQLDIRGWVLTFIDQILTIELYCQEKLLQSFSVNVIREDIAEKFINIPHSTKETGFFITYNLPFENINIYPFSLRLKLQNGEVYILCDFQLKIFQANPLPFSKKIEKTNSFKRYLSKVFSLFTR